MNRVEKNQVPDKSDESDESDSCGKQSMFFSWIFRFVMIIPIITEG